MRTLNLVTIVLHVVILNQVYLKKNVRRVNALEKIAAAHQTSIANIVLAFYLTRPAIDVIIPGAKRAEQVIENIKAADIVLSKDEIQYIDELFPIED